MRNEIKGADGLDKRDPPDHPGRAWQDTPTLIQNIPQGSDRIPSFGYIVRQNNNRALSRYSKTSQETSKMMTGETIYPQKLPNGYAKEAQ